MKNKYIFLIIAVGFVAYFLIRPQTGMSGAGMQQAQTMTTIMQRLCSFSNNLIICNLITGRGPIGGGTGTTGGNTGSGSSPANNAASPLVVTLGHGGPIQPITFSATDPYGNSYIAQGSSCGPLPATPCTYGYINCVSGARPPYYQCCKQVWDSNQGRWIQQCNPTR